jgi:sugar lactone lactonase YvrE
VADGGNAVGSDGVSAQSLGRIYIQETYAPPDLVPAPLPGDQAGKLLLARHGRVRPVADISAIERTRDPDGQGVDSNPYAVLALPGRQLVADAAGNTLLEVRNGHARVFAVLPDHDGHQSVPTSLAVGPRGTIYVGDLNGLNPGTARVWHLSASGRVLGWVGGFTTVTGVAAGRDGSLYVSELFAGGAAGPPGQVTRVLANGQRVQYPVPFPAGLAVDRHHHLYVSAWSIADADGTDLGGGFISAPGQVWRLTV